MKINQEEYKIGEGEPEFVADFKKPISIHSLVRSTSLALGEACMNGNLKIEGDLYDGIIDLHQIIFTNDVNNKLPMTKWY